MKDIAMLEINCVDVAGKVTGKVKLPADLFDVSVDQDLVALAVRMHEANQRQNGASAKSRGEVNRTGHKVWKQKGTGRARHGSKNAPIFVGGGVAHGPTGEENYSVTLNKKQKQLAIRGALTNAYRNQKIVVVDGFENFNGNTAALSSLLKNLKVSKSTILLSDVFEPVIRSGKNIQNLIVGQANRTNTYEIMNAGTLILDKKAIDTLEGTYGTPKVKA